MTDSKFTTIETERLILRAWKSEDAEAFARMNIDPIVMEYLPRALNRKDSDKLLKRFQAHFTKHGYGLFAMERKEDGEFVGFTGLQNVEFDAHFTPAVEIAWRLDTEYWGKGYATEAAKAVLDYAFNTLKLKDVVTFTVHDNERMMHVFDKMGMTCDEDGDFDYPTLPEGHPLGKFTLYRMTKKTLVETFKA
jgi:RimJ/RimL family protein N-acetyltransferase